MLTFWISVVKYRCVTNPKDLPGRQNLPVLYNVALQTTADKMYIQFRLKVYSM